MSLTPKQEKFCQEYIRTGNKSEAYRLAYDADKMTSKSVNELACQMFNDIKITSRVEELQNEVLERNRITVDELVEILAKKAKFDIADLYDEDGNLKNIHKIPKDARISIEGLDVEENKVEGVLVSTTKKVKISNRDSSIDKLLKVLGGYEKDNSQKKPQVAINEVDTVIFKDFSDGVDSK